MSESKLSLPARPSVEQLRKLAKELLKKVRGGDAVAGGRFALVLGKKTGEPGRRATLSDAQFVLAREYGFENWMGLVKHVSETNPVGLGKYERLAGSVAKAYVTGDVEAIRRVNWLYGTSFLWDREPVKMQERLAGWFKAGPGERTDALALEDARYLVARMMGVGNWGDLVRGVASVAAGKAEGAVFYRMNAAGDGIQTRGPLGEAEWEQVFGIVKEKGLTKLTGSGEMSNAVMLKLSRLTGLKELWLDGVQIQDEGLLHLGGIAGLEVLDLSGPKSTLTDAGLAVLRDLKKLKVFKACWPQNFTDEGTVNLAGCDALEEVNLMGTHTGDATLAALAGKGRLKKLTTGRKVTDAGVPMLHGIPAFKTWQGGEHESPGLMSFMAGPTQLILDGPVTDEGLNGLSGLDGLFGLGFFWHAKAFTSGGLEPMTRMGNLRFFACDGSKVDDTAMEVISRMPRLMMLQGQGAVASDAGFEALSRSKTLAYFWGRECPNLTGVGFRALCALPSLKGLGVSCAKVDLGSLAGLAGAPGLRDLMPMDVPDAGFEAVGRCAGLENLWCMYCRETTDVATEYLGGLKRLKHYYAGRTLITDRSLLLLSKMETLEKVELWQTMGVTDVGVRALAGLPRLKKISMSGLTGVTREVLKAFGPGVEVEM